MSWSIFTAVCGFSAFYTVLCRFLLNLLVPFCIRSTVVLRVYVDQHESQWINHAVDLTHLTLHLGWPGSMDIKEFFEGFSRVKGTAHGKHLLKLHYDLVKQISVPAVEVEILDEIILAKVCARS